MRKPARRFPKPIPDLIAGPFSGMRDTTAPAAGAEDMARLIRNAYIPPGPPGTPVVGRPGFEQAGAQLGSSGYRRGQCIAQFTKINGATFTIAICGGQFYTRNWVTGALTETIDAAAFASAGITVAKDRRIYAVTYANHVVFNDGVNTMWAWDGTTNGGLTKLTVIPVSFGQPVVYYSKLFVTYDVQRDTIGWSEEAELNVGFDTINPPNSWDPAIADTGPIYTQAATNDGLYVMRRRSITFIQGAVADDFQTSGSRSAVGDSTGTVSPALVYDGGVVIVNDQAQPYLLRGTSLVPMWPDAQETVALVPRASLGAVHIIDYKPANLLLIAMPGPGEVVPSFCLVYRLGAGKEDRKDAVPSLTGTWDWDNQPFDTIGMVQDGAGNAVLMHFGNEDGYLYLHANPDGWVWNDAFNAGTEAIAHELIPHPMGVEAVVEKHWDRLDIVSAPDTDMTLSVVCETPRGSAAAAAMLFATTGAQWDAVLWDAFVWAGAEPETKKPLGTNVHGRWMIPRTSHGTLGERFRITAYQAAATEDWDDPTAF